MIPGCLTAILLAAPVIAGAEDLKLNVKNVVEAYKLVRVEAQGSIDSAKFLVEPSDEIDMIAEKDGKTAAFVAPPGRYVVTVVAVKAGTILTERTVVQVKEPSSRPNPPQPASSSSPPSGAALGLADHVKLRMTRLETSSENRKAWSALFAKIFERTSDLPAISTQALWVATESAMLASMPAADYAYWHENMFGPLKIETYTLEYSKGSRFDSKARQAAWMEIARGFQEFAK